jgi:hypothetical protein
MQVQESEEAFSFPCVLVPFVASATNIWLFPKPHCRIWIVIVGDGKHLGLLNQLG